MDGKRLYLKVIFLVGIMTICAVGTCFAQSPERSFPAEKCGELQRQIDQIVEIWQSSSMSDKEKVAQLTASLTQSMASLLKPSSDPEAAKVSKDMFDSIKSLLSASGAQGATQDKQVSENAAKDLEIIRQRTKPYIAVMQMFCPDLKVPNLVTK